MFISLQYRPGEFTVCEKNRITKNKLFVSLRNDGMKDYSSKKTVIKKKSSKK